jgi:hypothetical protein
MNDADTCFARDGCPFLSTCFATRIDDNNSPPEGSGPSKDAKAKVAISDLGS